MKSGAIAALLVLATSQSSEAPHSPPDVVLRADFDGDALADTAIVTFVREQSSNCRVVIDRDTLAYYGESLHGTAFVVDIDTTDGFREIAIPEWGPSDDDAVYFVRYSPESLRVLGCLPGRLQEDLHIDGSGVVQTTCRGERLHTWWYPCSFRILTGLWAGS